MARRLSFFVIVMALLAPAAARAELACDPDEPFNGSDITPGPSVDIDDEASKAAMGDEVAFRLLCATAKMELGNEPLIMDGMSFAMRIGKILELRDDVATAAKWFEIDARRGDPSALTSLAGLMIEGRGVPADPQHGVDLLQQAANKGYQPAIERLGFELMTNAAVKNEQAALHWLLCAREHADAVTAAYIDYLLPAGATDPMGSYPCP